MNIPNMVLTLGDEHTQHGTDTRDKHTQHGTDTGGQTLWGMSLAVAVHSHPPLPG